MKSGIPNVDTVSRSQVDSKLIKVKKISLPVPIKPVVFSLTFDEAKSSSKLRKRKERQESVSSTKQDRKVIRSNSEERPVLLKPSDKDSGIRRVSSSGDFPKSMSDEKNVNRSPLKRNESDPVKYDEAEYDKTRSHERFSRAHNFRSKKHPQKRHKVRGPTRVKLKYEVLEASKKNLSNEGVTEVTTLKFLDLCEQPTQRSPSPTHTSVSPALDFATLHEQVECTEPLVSHPQNQVNEDMETMPSQLIAFNKMLSSPRNSIIATHRIYLDPDVPQIAPIAKLSRNPVDERIQKLNKQINSCKRKIMMSEADFESKTGSKPTQFDKMKDGTIRNLYVELSKLKREQKQLSETSVGCSRMHLNHTGESSVALQETVDEIRQKLRIQVGNKNVDLDTMTPEELIEEKIETQKALLFLESLHGRPQTKQDRDLVRPFYDRYRILKQMVHKVSSMSTSGELATIDENEAMLFVPSTSSSNETESEPTETLSSKCTLEDSNDTLLPENWHCLTKPDLLKQMSLIVEEKKKLRCRIKEFEKPMHINLCRTLTKEDKKPMEAVYVAYKKVKSRLRLMEALVGKL
ncbi:protein FAM13A [Dendroctonus ponderosae]|uniref:FAM13A-like domain-containing protein n=2 Tax=Dendroctonus ponderosae TaxID=77166 RepID=A0AAR5PFC7_DENPD|nr:protein FAM13A [Dendroctonus ponderosae]